MFLVQYISCDFRSEFGPTVSKKCVRADGRRTKEYTLVAFLHLLPTNTRFVSSGQLNVTDCKARQRARP